MSSGFVKHKDADQSVHLRSLISTFVIHLLESIIYKLATSKNYFFVTHSQLKACILEVLEQRTM